MDAQQGLKTRKKNKDAPLLYELQHRNINSIKDRQWTTSYYILLLLAAWFVLGTTATKTEYQVCLGQSAVLIALCIGNVLIALMGTVLILMYQFKLMRAREFSLELRPLLEPAPSGAEYEGKTEQDQKKYTNGAAIPFLMIGLYWISSMVVMSYWIARGP